MTSTLLKICLKLLAGAVLALLIALFYSASLWAVLFFLHMAALAPEFYFGDVFAVVFTVRAFLSIRYCLNDEDTPPFSVRCLGSFFVAVVYITLAGLLAVFL